MLPQYPPEQLQKLLEKLPKELLDTIYSEETAETIGNICEQYGIGDERVSDIAKLAGRVLTGLILPSEFEDTIRKNVDLPEVLAKAIVNDINRLIFYPHKAALEELHQTIGEKTAEKKNVGIPTPRHSDREGYTVEPEEQEEQRAKSKETREVFSEEQQRQDSYREPIE